MAFSSNWSSFFTIKKKGNKKSKKKQNNKLKIEKKKQQKTMRSRVTVEKCQVKSGIQKTKFDKLFKWNLN